MSGQAPLYEGPGGEVYESSEAATVPRGLYWGFTRAELTEELAKYKLAVKAASTLAGVSGGEGRIVRGKINGQEVEFGYPSGVRTLEEWRGELMNAFSLLDGDGPLLSDRSVGFVR